MMAPQLRGRQTNRAPAGLPPTLYALAWTGADWAPLLSISTGLTDSTSVDASSNVTPIAARADRKDLIRGDISRFMSVLLNG
jgi:hypothetical protein